MKFKLTISPSTIAKRLVLIVIVLTAVSVAIQFGKYVYNAPWARSDWAKMFNLDREMNFPSWYSTLMLAFCALLLGAIAAGKKTESDRFWRYWKVLSTIFWFLAVDELFSIHEILIIPDVAKALKLPWFLHSMWVIPAIVLVAIFLQKYWKFTLHLPRRSRFHFMLAAFLYIGGALGMEMVGSYIAEWQGQQNLLYALVATTEEVIEMIGIIVFIYGLLYYLGRWAKHIDIKIIPLLGGDWH
jgi:hypothetical protein